MKIYGSELDDYIELGEAKPCIDKIDMLHMCVLVSLLFYSILKLGLMAEGHLFVTIDGGLNWLPDMQIQCSELLTNSPRFISLFTMCYLGRAKFTGLKDTMPAL